MRAPRSLAAVSLVAVSALLVSGCSSADDDKKKESSSESSVVEIEDNNGTQKVTTPPKSVVATDNRTFQTLADWDIELSAAAVSLMPDTIDYTTDESVVDLGLHTEPDLEAVVAVEPDLIINGQRFTQYQEDFASLVPDATILNLDPREGEPLDAELKRQTSALGEIFGKQDEAAALNDELDAAVSRVKDLYDPAQTVMAVNTSGGEIGYIAPGVGRTLGPIFDLIGMTPALEVADGTDDHQGDDISVEAIASSNPDWILVMDRDAAIAADDPEYTPGAEVIESSQALTGVTAIQNKQIVYMPEDTYTNEGIQTYTKFLNDFADALEDQA